MDFGSLKCIFFGLYIIKARFEMTECVRFAGLVCCEECIFKRIACAIKLVIYSRKLPCTCCTASK